MGKTRDLFKKMSDTKEIFHAKMGTIKNRNRKKNEKNEDSLRNLWYNINAPIFAL